jgi:hypothetical protein
VKRLQDRADALARAEQKRRVDALAEQWRLVPGVRLVVGPSELIIEARGLRKRRLTDAALRFVGVGR